MAKQISASIEIPPKPSPPQQIKDAASNGSLVIFVGAGISRLVNAPSWDGFANAVIDQVVSEEAMNYDEARRIKEIADPRRRLSLALIVARKKEIQIDYEKILHKKKSQNQQEDVYKWLNQFECTFVTTNYDKFLTRKLQATVDEGSEADDSTEEDESNWRVTKSSDFHTTKLDAIEGKKAKIIHLHGVMNDHDGMVITTDQYLRHYTNPQVTEFLKYLFSKTVLFIGYGLEEMEILEYLLRNKESDNGKSEADDKVARLFILQGYYGSDQMLCDTMNAYYQDLGVTLVPFLLDEKRYEQQVDILKDWSKKLNFQSPGLSHNLKMLRDEMDG